MSLCGRIYRLVTPKWTLNATIRTKIATNYANKMFIVIFRYASSAVNSNDSLPADRNGDSVKSTWNSKWIYIQKWCKNSRRVCVQEFALRRRVNSNVCVNRLDFYHIIMDVFIALALPILIISCTYVIVHYNVGLFQQHEINIDRRRNEKFGLRSPIHANPIWPSHHNCHMIWCNSFIEFNDIKWMCIHTHTKAKVNRAQHMELIFENLFLHTL